VGRDLSRYGSRYGFRYGFRHGYSRRERDSGSGTPAGPEESTECAAGCTEDEMGRPAFTGKGDVEEAEQADAGQDGRSDGTTHHDESKHQAPGEGDDRPCGDVSNLVDHLDEPVDERRGPIVPNGSPGGGVLRGVGVNRCNHGGEPTDHLLGRRRRWLQTTSPEQGNGTGNRSIRDGA